MPANVRKLTVWSIFKQAKSSWEKEEEKEISWVALDRQQKVREQRRNLNYNFGFRLLHVHAGSAENWHTRDGTQIPGTVTASSRAKTLRKLNFDNCFKTHNFFPFLHGPNHQPYQIPVAFWTCSPAPNKLKLNFQNCPSKFFHPSSRIALVYQLFCSRATADRLYYDWIAEKNLVEWRSWNKLNIPRLKEANSAASFVYDVGDLPES